MRFAGIRKAILSVVLSLVLTLPLAPAGAQTAAADVEKYIADIMALYDVPGLGVGLIRNGEIVLNKGFGVRSTQTNVPVTENTAFGIGSITKSFTALGVMKLVEEGKLDLDKPIITYVPDFKLSDDEATQIVTLRMALSMTTGLPRADDQWYLDASLTREQIIKNMAEINLTSRPGGLWQYNNQNFVLAGYVIERVTGQSWEDYTRQSILEPLGMTATTFSQADMRKAADFAVPHRLDVRKGMQPLEARDILEAVGPAGSINASLNDMLAYAAFQIGDGTANGKRIISKTLLDEMHARQVAVGTDSAPTAQPTAEPTAEPTGMPTAEAAGQPIAPFVTRIGYGMGWFTQDFRGYSIVEHGGNVDGFTASVTLIPSEQAAIVLLANADLANLAIEALRFRLTEWLLGLENTRDYAAELNKAAGFDPEALKARLEKARNFKLDLKALEPLLGDYDGPSGKLTVRLTGEKVFLRQSVRDQFIDVELVPFETNAFMINGGQGVGQVLRFEVEGDGTIALYQGDLRVAQRLPAGQETVEVRDPNGKYRFNLPRGLVAVPFAGLLVIQSQDPAGVIATGAFQAQSDDLRAELDRYTRQFDPTWNEEPESTRQLTTPNGLTWTEFIYQLPSDQVSVNWLFKQGSSIYYVGYTGKNADAAALQAILDGIANSFEVTAAE